MPKTRKPASPTVKGLGEARAAQWLEVLEAVIISAVLRWFPGACMGCGRGVERCERMRRSFDGVSHGRTMAGRQAISQSVSRSVR